MTASSSLLDWIVSLLRDPHARAAFQADPNGYSADHGFEHLSAADVHDALWLIADNASASYDHKFTESNDVHYPPPHHVDPHQDAPHYLNHYITNNYKIVDEHNTNIDDSVHQDINTHGGDFDQTIDNDPVVASGDHSVASGGDIDGSTITSGEGNVVGDGNHAVTGDHDTTSFGSGNASNTHLDHSNFGDGSAVSGDGDAAGHHTDNDTTTAVHNSGSGDTSVNAAGSHGYADGYSDQSSHDDATHTNYEDHSTGDSHDDYASHNSDHLADSHDTDVHHV